MKHTREELRQWQALPLGIKINMSIERIRNWINEFSTEGAYVSFSGGKDSTVLLDIVRNRMGYTEIPAVFVDTGLEYPEIREFVKTFDNVVWLKPKMNFRKVIETYGYPFISKEVSESVYYARKYLHTIENSEMIARQTDRQTDSKPIIGAHGFADLLGIERRDRGSKPQYQNLMMGIIPDGIENMPIRVQQLFGRVQHNEKGKLTDEYSKRYDKQKYQFFLDAPFEIANHCCKVMKKAPISLYAKQSGRKPMTAMMACESSLREASWIKNGCNSFNSKHPMSNPLAFWTEQDILHYIKDNNIKICSVYGDIVEDTDGIQGQMDLSDFGLMEDTRKYKTTGCNRTGCMFCGYGCHLDKDGQHRFENMKVTHPKQYDYIMRPWEQGGLNYKFVIDWINEHGNLNIKY